VRLHHQHQHQHHLILVQHATPLQEVWAQLMVCRRSHLMALIPLASQHMEQLAGAAASTAAVLQALLGPLQPQLDRLGVFASAHKSIAEELQQEGTAEALVGGVQGF
jgi:hypothetical protein